MKRIALVVAMCVVSAYALAAGVPFAVKSLQAAQDLVKQDSSRHVLVFYTSEN